VKRVAYCSFGADSTANVLLGMEHGEPPDEIVYCEVMFDKNISGEILPVKLTAVSGEHCVGTII